MRIGLEAFLERKYLLALGILCLVLALAATGYLSVLLSEASCRRQSLNYISTFLWTDLSQTQVSWLPQEAWDQDKEKSAYSYLAPNLSSDDAMASIVPMPSLVPFLFRIEIKCYGPKAGTAGARLTYLTFFGHVHLLSFYGQRHPDGFTGRSLTAPWDPGKEK